MRLVDDQKIPKNNQNIHRTYHREEKGSKLGHQRVKNSINRGERGHFHHCCLTKTPKIGKTLFFRLHIWRAMVDEINSFLNQVSTLPFLLQIHSFFMVFRENLGPHSLKFNMILHVRALSMLNMQMYVG
jgi:hypothetical protein